MDDNNSKPLLQEEVESRNEKTCCGIRLKKNITYCNLFAIFYISFLLIAANAYVNM